MGSERGTSQELGSRDGRGQLSWGSEHSSPPWADDSENATEQCLVLVFGDRFGDGN